MSHKNLYKYPQVYDKMFNDYYQRIANQNCSEISSLHVRMIIFENEVLEWRKNCTSTPSVRTQNSAAIMEKEYEGFAKRFF